MYYVALFEHSEYGNVLSDEKEARDDGLAVFQAIVKAKDISSAEKKFREMLLRLHLCTKASCEEKTVAKN